MKDTELAKNIAARVKNAGGKAYYVGGFVRDRLLGIPNKDVDLEIHGIEPASLWSILGEVGEPFEKGTSFGVYGLRGSGIDIAMPRRERSTGRGHKDFEIYVEPGIGEKQAALRRDFTVNAMMEDVLTHDVLDFFGGKRDLETRVLRYVDKDTFAEDELRVLRGAQFAARFGFTLSDELILLASSMPLNNLPRERVYEELSKALLKSETPSVFFETLRKIKQLSFWFPETEELIGLKQNPRFHGEGDVWNHTMAVLDAAAKYRREVSYPEGFMLSALMHDYGKITTTEETDGVIHSYGHETAGIPLAEKALNRLTGDRKLQKYVLNMVRLHMKPNVVAAAKSKPKVTNAMFHESVCPRDLVFLARSDSDGQLCTSGKEEYFPFLMSRLESYEELMKQPWFGGDDLLRNGVKRSPEFSEIMAYALKLRLAGIPSDKALKETLAYARKTQKNT